MVIKNGYVLLTIYFGLFVYCEGLNLPVPRSDPFLTSTNNQEDLDPVFGESERLILSLDTGICLLNENDNQFEDFWNCNLNSVALLPPVTQATHSHSSGSPSSSIPSSSSSFETTFISTPTSTLSNYSTDPGQPFSSYYVNSTGTTASTNITTSSSSLATSPINQSSTLCDDYGITTIVPLTAVSSIPLSSSTTSSSSSPNGGKTDKDATNVHHNHTYTTPISSQVDQYQQPSNYLYPHQHQANLPHLQPQYQQQHISLREQFAIYGGRSSSRGSEGDVSRSSGFNDTSDDDSSITRDEKRAKALNIPIPAEEIINLPIDEFNERLAKYDLNESQLSLIRDIRRRGKNKVAAQNCRRRKMDQIIDLQSEVGRLYSQKKTYEVQQEHLLALRHLAQEKYTKLYNFILSSSGSSSTLSNIQTM